VAVAQCAGAAGHPDRAHRGGEARRARPRCPRTAVRRRRDGDDVAAYGPVAYHLGELDLLLGDLAAATDHLRAAVEHADALGARIWAALARVALGEALDRAGGRGADRELLERGRDEARRLGLAVAADRAEARLRLAARGAPRAPAPPGRSRNGSRPPRPAPPVRGRAAERDVRRPPRRRPPFASSTSTAPVAGSSGEVVRNRLDLGGQRHRNEVMDIAAGVQAPR
jgi:hypothetical protein